jgi:hypothetical protein
MNEGDLDMGDVSVHGPAPKAASDVISKEDCPTTADAFNKILKQQRDAGDFDKSAEQSKSNAEQATKAGDNKCAAAILEAAGADTLKSKNPNLTPAQKHIAAQELYTKAGMARAQAGVHAGTDHKEAARNYNKGKEDLKTAADNAKKAADELSTASKGVGKMAAEEEKAAKKGH